MGLCGIRGALTSPVFASGLEITEAERGLYSALDPARTSEGVETNFAQAYILVRFVDSTYQLNGVTWVCLGCRGR